MRSIEYQESTKMEDDTKDRSNSCIDCISDFPRNERRKKLAESKKAV